MKKLLYSLLTLAAALTVASCQKEMVGSPDPTQGGPTVKAELSINLNQQVATKAFAAAENAKKLHIAFYSGGELVESLSKTGTDAITLTGTTYEYTAKISRGVAYDIICWAEAADSPYALDFDAQTVTYKANAALTANNDAYDAFYGKASLTAGETSLRIDLTRPFAQVNVLVPDANVSGYTSFSSAMTVTVPTTMSLADGTLSGDAKEVTFVSAPIDETTIKAGYKYLAMNYVFAPAEAANYPVSFTVTPDVAADAKTLDLSAVSLKRNRRTNLVGNLFDTEVDGTVTIVILPTPEQTEEEVDTEAKDPEVDVALASGGEITEPLSVDVDGTALFIIATNSTGAVTVSSEDPEVATASYAEETGTVTATGVAEGTTYIVANIAAGQTKGALNAATVKVQIKVGDGVKKGEQSIAYDAETAEVTIGAEDNTFPTLDVSSAKGAISYSSSNEQVATVSNEGVVTLVAAGSTTINATAAEYTDTDSGLFYPEVTASYTLTVSEAAPAAATQLTMSEVSCTNNGESMNSLSFSWTVVDNATGYQVSTDGETYGETQTAASYTINNLSAGTEYTLYVKAIGDGESYTDSDAVTATGTTKKFTTIAELKALLTTTSASHTGTLTDAVVSFVPATGTAIIKDNSASIMYFKKDHGLKQGQTFSGEITVDAIVYNSLYSEITSIGNAAFTGDEAVVEPETVTLAQLTAEGAYATYENAYVKVVGMTSGTTTTAKGNIDATQNDASYVVYTNVAIPIHEGDVFTAEGTITKHDSTEQLKVWATDDLTITQAAPVLSASPATKTVNADVTSVTWTISSNTDWAITPGEGVTASATSGNGNAEVTLTFAANTTTEAKTLTATAKATGCEDVTITITQNGTETVITTPDPETIVFADITPALENGVQYTDPFNGGNFTITFAGGSNDGKYYTTGVGIRTYGGGKITIASTDYTISKIVFAWDGDYKPGSSDVLNTGTFNDGCTEWTGDASSVVLTRPSGSGHWRLQSVTVTYK